MLRNTFPTRKDCACAYGSGATETLFHIFLIVLTAPLRDHWLQPMIVSKVSVVSVSSLLADPEYYFGWG